MWFEGTCLGEKIVQAAQKYSARADDLRGMLEQTHKRLQVPALARALAPLRSEHVDEPGHLHLRQSELHR